MSLSFHQLSHSYGKTRVLQDISFEAHEGEILCLLGPSGGGKSTLLRLAAGLESLQAGQIKHRGELLAHPGSEPAPEDRPIGLVFQDHMLFPHLTVNANLGFGLKGLPRAEIDERTTRLLASMELQGLGQRYPHELSGGQQQRVALARALAPGPSVLLLDEPFASVDSTLRRELRRTTRNALKSTDTTAIVVTHDPEEAMQLADSIAIMANGTIAQHASPEKIWQAPATLDVALLFGNTQALEGKSDGQHADCGFNLLPCDHPPGDVIVAARPQGVRLSTTATHDGPPLEVKDIRLLGHQWQVMLETTTGEPTSLLASVDQLNNIAVGHRLHAVLDPGHCFIYPQQSTSTQRNSKEA